MTRTKDKDINQLDHWKYHDRPLNHIRFIHQSVRSHHIFFRAPINSKPDWDSPPQEEQERSGVYIKNPRGFMQPGKVLKIIRFLYGLKQIPHNFFHRLKSNLEGTGLEPIDDVDPCLFISDKVVCMVYVDDILFFGPEERYISEAIKKISYTEV